MSHPGFQRARQPEQKEQRRQELLDAAARLLGDGGLEAVTLTAIARAAKVAKSNIYRYFGSREEILLEILVDDELAWVRDLERALYGMGGGDEIDTVASIMARTIAARPITCQLISVVANVLEHNLTPEAVLRFKSRVLELSASGSATRSTPRCPICPARGPRRSCATCTPWSPGCGRWRTRRRWPAS